MVVSILTSLFVATRMVRVEEILTSQLPSRATLLYLLLPSTDVQSHASDRYWDPSTKLSMFDLPLWWFFWQLCSRQNVFNLIIIQSPKLIRFVLLAGTELTLFPLDHRSGFTIVVRRHRWESIQGGTRMKMTKVYYFIIHQNICIIFEQYCPK